jgi:hypothetical protein
VRGDVRDRPRRRDGAHAGALALAVAIVVIALAGCGGGDEDDTSSSRTASTSAQAPASTSTTAGGDDGSVPETPGSKQAVRTAVEVVLTSGDPADACGRYVTDHYLRVAYGGRQGCIQAQGPGSAARSLRTFRAHSGEVAGTASAEAVPVGGPYDGAKLRVSLVQGGPGYQVDALHSNVPVGP